MTGIISQNGYVWKDYNGNGIQDDDEPGMEDVTVTLLDSDGNKVAQTESSSDGSYFIGDLDAGSYQLHFSIDKDTQSELAKKFPEVTDQDIGGDTFTADQKDSDVGSDGYTPTFELVNNIFNTKQDAGFKRDPSLVEIGDQVWYDTTPDGIFDPATESGAAGIDVQALSSSGDLIAKTTTDEDGIYRFNELWPGDYQIRFMAPQDYVFTHRYAGSDTTVDSNADADGYSKVLTLTDGEVNKTIDAGLALAASIGDRIWLDADGLGTQNNNEPGAEGVDVTLVRDGVDLRTVQSQTDGSYLFEDLIPDDYQIRVDLPNSSGLIVTRPDMGNDEALDSDADLAYGGKTGLTSVFNVKGGEDITHIDIGLFKESDLVDLGDKVWRDINADGSQFDANGDREPGLANIDVALLTGSGVALTTTTTDSNGIYRFNELWPGDYQVDFRTGAASLTEKQAAGVSAEDNSDANANGKTDTITLSAGDTRLDIDAGVVATAAIGDRVWIDSNGNGRQNSGEPGMSNVNVKLLDANRAPVMFNGQPVQDTTDANGNYSFENLPAGQYRVQFDLPGRYAFTKRDAGSDNADSDAYGSGLTTVYTLTDGQQQMTVDAGLIGTAAIGNRVWQDSNGNGVQNRGEPGVAGVRVKLLDSNNNPVVFDGQRMETTTNQNGWYKFENLMAGQYRVKFELPNNYNFTKVNAARDNVDSDAYSNGFTQVYTLGHGQQQMNVDAGLRGTAAIGNRVWQDSNGNGVQDRGEPGIAGVRVKLLDANNNPVVFDGQRVETFTNSVGGYKFQNLVAGQYRVKFELPNNYNFTKVNAARDTVDSDAYSNGLTQVYTVSNGQQQMNVDAGLRGTAAIGNRVWLDKDGDGVQDRGEAGIAGVRVKLLDGSGNPVVFDGQRVETLTNSAGGYKFQNLVAGRYRVKFELPDSSYEYTRKDATNRQDILDSDADSNGLTDVYRLVNGQQQMNVDAGFTRGGSIGDYVWNDIVQPGAKSVNGIQDANESGLGGVTVQLRVKNGGGWSHVATTKTDANGAYKFEQLDPGKYAVKFIKHGYSMTYQNQGRNDARDSDADQDTGIAVVTVGTNQHINTIDAGMSRGASIGDYVWSDHLGWGPRYDLNGIQDEPGAIKGMTIDLYSAATGFVARTVSGGNGNYGFNDLLPGTYRIKTHHSSILVDDGAGGQRRLGVTGAVNAQNNTKDTIDSDVHGSGYSDWVTVRAGQHYKHLDGGFTPIAIDLNGDGVQTLSRDEASATFDLTGSNQQVASGWLSAQDGLLALDQNGNGNIDNITELFGGLNKGAGFAKLAEFDSNQDGVVNADDTRFAELKIWQDANSNKVTDEGELNTLDEAGVSSLQVDYVEVPEIDANGNLHLERSSATLADGSVVDMTDVYFNVSQADAEAAGVELPTFAELLSDSAPLFDGAEVPAPAALAPSVDHHQTSAALADTMTDEQGLF